MMYNGTLPSQPGRHTCDDDASLVRSVRKVPVVSTVNAKIAAPTTKATTMIAISRALIPHPEIFLGNEKLFTCHLRRDRETNFVSFVLKLVSRLFLFYDYHLLFGIFA